MDKQHASAFHALGEEDADELTIKADLAIAIVGCFAAQGLNNSQAAKLAGIRRTDVLNLKNSLGWKYSISWLIKALNRLNPDLRVRVVIAPWSTPQPEEGGMGPYNQGIPDFTQEAVGSSRPGAVEPESRESVA